MGNRELTAKQEEFFQLLLKLFREAGAPPTIRELQTAGRYSSPRSVTQFIEVLEDAGYIQRAEGARNIRVRRFDSRIGSDRTRTVDVPVVGSVAAGSPILAVENVETTLPVSERIARPPHRYFFLRVEGDSMDRAGIKDGSLALIRQQETARPGDSVVALIDDHATIKRLRLAAGVAVLVPVSSNPKYKPILVDEGFRVQGVVVTTVPDVRSLRS